MFKTFDEAQRYMADNGVKMVDFKMVDLSGRWRHISIPTSRFQSSLMESGIGFDGSNYGFAPVEKSDMIFIPDLSSAAEDPFVQVKTISMIGDVFVIDQPNRRFDQDPRNVSKHAVEYMKSTGIADQMIIGPEFEFNILNNVCYQVKSEQVSYAVDTEEAEWNSSNEYDNAGFQLPQAGGYHIDKPGDVSYDLRSRICLMLEDAGVDVKYHHHEVGGSGQMEIEVELGEMTDMADKTMIIKYMVRNAAIQDGKTATFMPKPIYGEAGNGMHVHMLLMKDGQPIFCDDNGYSGLSETAHYFIGGLLSHAASLCAFTNPSTNSFKRLVPGFEAPVTIGYATSNRSAVIRIPAYAKAPNKRRFELRCPDATCNPYYAYSAILLAGLDGVQKKIDPSKGGWGPFDFNLYTLSDEEQAKLQALPKSLDEALDALEKDHDYLTAGGVFPQRLIDIWIAKKRSEAKKINQIPHPAEFAAYFDL
ncbi:MAG TPA: type I glutamate--ammonia ligase [Lachnospiraceae bacterium]|nr:type I glutamate--ammonia ligase [Lachnospiraceae bacterium]